MPPEAIAQSATLEANEFRVQERAVHLGSSRMQPDSILDKSKTDFVFPEDFDIDDYVAYSSPLSSNLGSVLMERTSSDGRAFGKFIGPFSDKDAHKYCELQVKGVGIQKNTKVEGLQNPQVVDAGFASLSTHTTESGRELPLRYITEKTLKVTGLPGFSLTQGAVLHEDEASRKLAEGGLRTRRLVYSANLGDKVPISTPEGIKYTPEIEEIIKTRPGIEIWAIRSRYRLRDLENYGRFQETDWDLRTANRDYMDDKRNYALIDKPSHVRAKEKLALDNQAMEEVARDFEFMASEIMQRAQHDEDQRFLDLYSEFKEVDLKERSQQQKFWERYLQVFSGILGEQVGVMYKMGAFTKDDMLNSQNVTLMAEIVDHDVTYFDADAKKDSQKVVDQFTQTIKSLTSMATKFYSVGLLPDDIDAYSIVANYAQGVLSKLDQADRELLQETLQQLLPKSTEEELAGFSPYESLKQTLADYGDREDIRQDTLQALAPLKSGVVNALYLSEKKLKHFPKIDVLGRADVRTIVDYIVARAA